LDLALANQVLKLTNVSNRQFFYSNLQYGNFSEDHWTILGIVVGPWGSYELSAPENHFLGYGIVQLWSNFSSWYMDLNEVVEEPVMNNLIFHLPVQSYR
jgi:hypothetical protein